jgi:hypothetical protein
LKQVEKEVFGELSCPALQQVQMNFIYLYVGILCLSKNVKKPKIQDSLFS